jgi:hypothetical protein
MDIAAILALVTKGISIASALIEAGQSAAPAFAAIENLFKAKETITQADMDAADSVLDGLLADFNLDLPSA